MIIALLSIAFVSWIIVFVYCVAWMLSKLLPPMYSKNFDHDAEALR